MTATHVAVTSVSTTAATHLLPAEDRPCGVQLHHGRVVVSAPWLDPEPGETKRRSWMQQGRCSPSSRRGATPPSRQTTEGAPAFEGSSTRDDRTFLSVTRSGLVAEARGTRAGDPVPSPPNRDRRMSATETDHADSISDPAERRLAVYGSLAPGRSNHHVLDGLAGRWTEGHVRGRLLAAGWGAELGYPGLILDSRAATVPVQVFESSALPAHWGRLDDFEGPGYERVVATVQTADGDLPACIYVLGGLRPRPPWEA